MFCPWDEQLLSECVSGSETAIFKKNLKQKWFLQLIFQFTKTAPEVILLVV